MEGEINNLVMVWMTVVASLCYCQTIGKIITHGTTRLLAILPVILLFLVLPLNLRTIFLGGPISFFVAWLATFKLLLFAYGKGPLSSNPPLPLPRFIPLACFPIKIQNEPSPNTAKQGQKSLTNYAIKALVFATIIPVYQNKSSIHPKVFLFFYCIYVYTGLEIILAMAAASVRAALGVELEPQFEEPYLSTSLQDFWGRRWNLMASAILRPTVYTPVRTITSRWIGRKWAPVPAVIAAFLVSGIMHELIFYNIGRSKPTWEVSWFFLLHGICLAIEVSIKKAVNEKWRLPPVVSGLMAVAFVMATGLGLFLPALMRLEADVMAHREIVAFIEFVKSVSIQLRMDKVIVFSAFGSS
ncbi:acyl-CoA--sterol O-acyltransferase 1-like [Humulus lupulus]|uniref:acyl-CoA--sterol O-acyltransferase 1-like n=1 Tax=Humulus lupulus TaxID=3486 RepID=UPI002B4030EE|nr:acyl-CoA--sterol O-acyltransferase 1-like [Humulus lupulus]